MVVYCVIELLRESIHSEASLMQVILQASWILIISKLTIYLHSLNCQFQAIKIESGFVFLALIIFLLSAFPFCWSTIWCFTQKYRNSYSDGVTDLGFSSMSSQMQHSETLMTEDLKFQLDQIHVKKRKYVVLLQMIVVFTMWVIKTLPKNSLMQSQFI